MAAQAEVLVEVPDVLGHAARQRIDVRRDEADLHRCRFCARHGRLSVRCRSQASSKRGGRWRPAGVAEIAAGPVRRTFAPTEARASREYLRSCRPNVASWPVVPWNEPC